MYIDIFPTLIGVYEDVISNDDNNNIVNIINTLSLEKHNALSGYGISSHKNNENIISLFKMEIQDKIIDKVNQYIDVSKFKAKEIANSWVNIQNKGDSLIKHAHPMSVISGALYINTNNKLRFHNPNQYILYSQVEKDLRTKYNSEWFDIQTKNNMLLLFPSWMAHSFDKCCVDNHTVISFNIK